MLEKKNKAVKALLIFLGLINLGIGIAGFCLCFSTNNPANVLIGIAGCAAFLTVILYLKFEK